MREVQVTKSTTKKKSTKKNRSARRKKDGVHMTFKDVYSVELGSHVVVDAELVVDGVRVCAVSVNGNYRTCAVTKAIAAIHAALAP